MERVTCLSSEAGRTKQNKEQKKEQVGVMAVTGHLRHGVKKGFAFFIHIASTILQPSRDASKENRVVRFWCQKGSMNAAEILEAIFAIV